MQLEEPHCRYCDNQRGWGGCYVCAPKREAQEQRQRAEQAEAQIAGALRYCPDGPCTGAVHAWSMERKLLEAEAEVARWIAEVDRLRAVLGEVERVVTNA